MTLPFSRILFEQGQSFAPPPDQPWHSHLASLQPPDYPLPSSPPPALKPALFQVTRFFVFSPPRWLLGLSLYDSQIPTPLLTPFSGRALGVPLCPTGANPLFLRTGVLLRESDVFVARGRKSSFFFAIHWSTSHLLPPPTDVEKADPFPLDSGFRSVSKVLLGPDSFYGHFLFPVVVSSCFSIKSRSERLCCQGSRPLLSPNCPQFSQPSRFERLPVGRGGHFILCDSPILFFSPGCNSE